MPNSLVKIQVHSLSKRDQAVYESSSCLSSRPRRAGRAAMCGTASNTHWRRVFYFGLFLGAVGILRSLNSIASRKDATPVNQGREAYVTVLGGDWEGGGGGAQMDQFQEVRRLAFQLLHDPATSDEREMVVLIIGDVPRHQLDQLRAEGVSIRFPAVHPRRRGSSSMKALDERFGLFAMTEYERAVYLHPELLINQPLTELWDDEAWSATALTAFRGTRTGRTQIQEDGAITPLDQAHEFDHGFMLVRPRRHVYVEMVDISDRDQGASFESILDQYATRHGIYPRPSIDDQYTTPLPPLDTATRERWSSTHARMQGFWLGRSMPIPLVVEDEERPPVLPGEAYDNEQGYGAETDKAAEDRYRYRYHAHNVYTPVDVGA